MTGCIYKITNKINNKFYIGSTNDYDRRHYEHFRQLKLGTHHCIYLQRAYDKYGEANFTSEIILEVSDSEDLLYYEQITLDKYAKEFKNRQIYNCCKVSGRPPSHSELSTEKQIIKAQKIRERNTGKPVSDETRKKISIALTGRKHTPENIEKIRELFSQDWVVIRPSGEILEVYNLNAFIRDENKRYNINLQQTLLQKTSSGERHHHLNYQCFKKKDFTPDKIQDLTKEIIRVKDPEGNILEFTEWRPFCREHNLDRKSLKDVLVFKKGKQHKGYRRVEE